MPLYVIMTYDLKPSYISLNNGDSLALWPAIATTQYYWYRGDGVAPPVWWTENSYTTQKPTAHKLYTSLAGPPSSVAFQSTIFDIIQISDVFSDSKFTAEKEAAREWRGGAQHKKSSLLLLLQWISSSIKSP